MALALAQAQAVAGADLAGPGAAADRSLGGAAGAGTDATAAADAAGGGAGGIGGIGGVGFAEFGGALGLDVLGGDFDGLAEAQAVGDFRVLSVRGRRMLGLDLGPDPAAALDTLARWIEGALA